MSVSGKTTIITGSAGGIGSACATRFAREGAKVVVSDIDEKSGQALVDRLKADGGEAMFVHCDVAQKLDVRNMVAATLDAYGSIDVLINNAGIVHSAEFLDLTEADFDRVLGINLKGSFLCGQAVARRMVEQVEAGGAPGAIVNMSSVNALFAIPNQVPYAISKGGVNQLTRVMAVGLSSYGIRVNAIGPGSIATDMLNKVMVDDKVRHTIMSRTPLGRLGDPAEIAAVAVFLASEESSYITGQTLYADGGRLPLNYTVPVKD